ncbi:aldose 1-epimerase family protein [Prevotella brunnea]|uniref:Aldose 1-epimerase family protein n=1 Tax=Prevotella brunnea TaxID=2508867 RepID=A0A5C8G675_9BACT|nr:aldose 1-epimerase family protein [Prevotella brunnea]MDR0185972.1 aldose 1-epimerase family protein [Prevotella brunnea]TXJ57189.1 aldose 1-epimerase family protein [Prevotella brunnea]
MEQIANDFLTIRVSELGAELTSIKNENGKEYLWQAHPKFWNRHSPILFPLVGKLWQDTFCIDGEEYHSKRHGFARDTEFKLIKKDANRLLFSMHDTEATYKIYPFHFILGVSYKLERNRIHVVWHVQNVDNKEIHFQIGGHPAFNLPDVKEGEPVKGYLKLNAEKLLRTKLSPEGNRLKGYTEFETDEGILEFDENTFKDDALIFEHSQLSDIQLLNRKGAPEVSLQFNTPAVGIWTPHGKCAPFICIEPWYGIADAVGYKGEFRERHLMNHLQPGASFMSEYIITIH